MLTSTAKLLYLALLASQVLASTRSFGGVNMDDIRNLEIDHLVKSNPKGIQKLVDTFGGLLERRIQEELYNKIVGIVTNALLSADSVIDISNSTALPETPTPENRTTEVPKVPTTHGGDDPTTQAGPRNPTTEGNGEGPCFPPGSCDDPTTEAGGPSCIAPEIPVPGTTLTICVDGTEICIEVKAGPVPLLDECFDLSDIQLPFPKDCPFSIPIPLPGDILTYLGQQTFAPLEPLVDLPPLPFLPTALPETIGNISSECIFSELQFVLDLVCSPRELYAFQMFDAMGKMPSGLLKGDLRWLGSFMQCRDIEDVENWLPFLEANSTYDAHYCLTTWQITTSEEANATKIPLQIGVCFPELCSQHDISTLLQFAFSSIFSDMFELESTFCEYDTPRDALGTAFLAIVLTLSALTIIGSTIDYLARVRYQRDPEDVYKINGDVTSYDNNAYDVQETPHAGIEMTETTNPDPKEKMTLENAMEKVEPQKDETENEESETLPTKSEKVADDNVSISESKFARYSSPIRAFSGFINGSKIFSTDYDRDDPNHPLMALHGMRVLTLWWVIYQMTYETSYEVLQNPLDLLWISERFHSQAISNGSFATDTFFVISGFLITYLALKKLDEDGSSWKMWLTYYFHRVWRFWPAYIIILLMYMWALPNMVGGPLSYIANDYVQPCYTYWWTNVIFINNLHPYFDPLRDKCMPWSWYIACVMQFYIISPCIILLLHWKKIVGFITIGLLFVLDFTCTALIATYYGLTASPGQSRFNDNADDNPMGDYLDTKPHTRIATYLIGMCLAYILIKHEEGRFKVNMKVSITGWLLSTFLGFTIVYCTYGTYHEPEWSQALTVFYLTVSRFTFGLAIAWVIFACATGHGGLVNTFLSWNFWLPLSRMSFCTYLVFPLMMAFWLLNNHVQPYISDFNFMYLFIAYMGIGYLMGFTFALIVERPFMQLERLMFGKGLEQSS